MNTTLHHLPNQPGLGTLSLARFVIYTLTAAVYVVDRSDWPIRYSSLYPSIKNLTFLCAFAFGSYDAALLVQWLLGRVFSF